VTPHIAKICRRFIPLAEEKKELTEEKRELMKGNS
jgi:hypothetical protein